MIPDIQVETINATVSIEELKHTTTRQVPLKWLLPQWEYESLRQRVRSGLKDLIMQVDNFDGSGETENG